MQFLRVEGRVSVHSEPQCMAAMTTIDRWFAHPQFSETTPLTNALFAAWRLAVVDSAAHDRVRTFPVPLIFTILAEAVFSMDVCVLWAALVIGLDFNSFNRTNTAFPIFTVDLLEERHHLVFRETRFKCKRVDLLLSYVPHYNAVHFPSLLLRLCTYRAAHREAFSEQLAASYLWQLRSESCLCVDLVHRIFAKAASVWPQFFPAGLSHHALHRGRATTTHAIDVPLETICFWAVGAFSSDAVFKYIESTHEPTPEDLKGFV